MSVVTFVEPNEEYIRVIADDMREADRAEIWASHRSTPLDSLMLGWKRSTSSVVVCVDGKPCVMLGLVIHDILTGTGIPWLLGTETALKHKREFFKLSPPVVDEMLETCPRLFNYVHDQNKVSIKWLQWVGFTIDDPEPIGVAGEMFHRFHMEKA